MEVVRKLNIEIEKVPRTDESDQKIAAINAKLDQVEAQFKDDQEFRIIDDAFRRQFPFEDSVNYLIAYENYMTKDEHSKYAPYIRYYCAMVTLLKKQPIIHPIERIHVDEVNYE